MCMGEIILLGKWCVIIFWGWNILYYIWMVEIRRKFNVVISYFIIIIEIIIKMLIFGFGLRLK